jgi:hypothetical protein
MVRKQFMLGSIGVVSFAKTGEAVAGHDRPE